MPATITGSHLGLDTHANRPAANAAGQPIGALYSCSTHGLIYKTDGSTWSTYATLGGGATSLDGLSDVSVGTSFPGSPATNDLCWRTDLKLLFYYDGTRWLSVEVLTTQILMTFASASTTLGDLRSTISATTSSVNRVGAPSVLGASNIWLVDWKVTFNVNGGGTALSGSHKWVGALSGFDLNAASTGSVGTITIDSGSSAVFRASTATIAAVQAAGTLFYAPTWTKTGTPGNLQTGETISYRIIGT